MKPNFTGGAQRRAPFHHAWPLGWLSVPMAALLLGGCAGFSADGGMDAVQQAVRQRSHHDVAWQRTDANRQAAQHRTTELLARPLSVDDAVQVALLNNRRLQSTLYQLGVSEADVVAAGRLPNPGFSFARLKRGDEVELERAFHFNLAWLLTFPLAHRVAQRQFERTQMQVSSSVLSLIDEVRKAYFDAVAAKQTVMYMGQVQEAADIGAELARRMAQAGNWSALQQARERAFHADAVLNAARAAQAALSARERLTRLLGIDPNQQAMVLPERLPDLPDHVEDRSGLEQTAMDQRLDVQAAKVHAAQLAGDLDLTRTTRFINVLDVGAAYNTSNQQPTQRGYEVSLELPLFDWGAARTAKAEAVYMQAVNEAAQTALDARSEVREAYQVYRSSFEVARRYRDDVVPLKKRISDEVLMRYNGMLASVFDLLADARSQIESVNGYIQAQRDFWIASANLEMALTGQGTAPTASRPEAP